MGNIIDSITHYTIYYIYTYYISSLYYNKQGLAKICITGTNIMSLFYIVGLFEVIVSHSFHDICHIISSPIILL